jgi:FKBP-type peptidyl-prolyl cis-trans isomerase SlpA
MSIKIEQGIRVTLYFSLKLENGETVDSNFDGKPATFTLGDGNLLPGFEAPLVGLEAGSQGEFVIAPEHAFGQLNPENIQVLSRDNFDQETLKIGDVFSFQNGDGELPGVIAAIHAENVDVDFNHPLAGRSIIFTVDIVDVELGSIH